MAFYVYTYVRREKIEFYEVPEGSIVNDQRHTGIAFRTETVKYTEQAGNINFYLREGKKAAVGTRVYSVDETGKLSELLAEKTDGSVALSRDNLASLKKQLSSFSQTFTENDFKTVYDTRYTLDSEVLEYVSVDALKNLDSVVEEMGVNFVQVRAGPVGDRFIYGGFPGGSGSEPGNGGDVRPVWLYEEYPEIREAGGRGGTGL